MSTGPRRVGLAEGGRILCMFDPYDPHERWGDDPDVAAPLVAVATERVTDQDPVGVGMVVVERFTGVAVTPDLINGVDTVHVIVRRLEDHQPADPRWHSLRSRHADLVDTIAPLSAGDCRGLAAWAAREAAVSSGLDEIPAIADAVAAVATSAADPLPPDTEVLLRRIMADGYRKKDEGPWLPSQPGVAMVRDIGPLTRQGGRRAAAAKALWGAANPDPLGAALDAIDSARFAWGHGESDFIDQVRQKLS